MSATGGFQTSERLGWSLTSVSIAMEGRCLQPGLMHWRLSSSPHLTLRVNYKLHEYLQVFINSVCLLHQFFELSSSGLTDTYFLAAKDAASFSSFYANFSLLISRGRVIRISRHLDWNTSDRMMSSIVGRFSSFFCRHYRIIFWKSPCT